MLTEQIGTRTEQEKRIFRRQKKSHGRGGGEGGGLLMDFFYGSIITAGGCRTSGEASYVASCADSRCRICSPTTCVHISLDQRENVHTHTHAHAHTEVMEQLMPWNKNK